MSNKQDWVAEALARCEAATPGPWRNSSGKGSGAVSSNAAGCAIYINTCGVELRDTVERWHLDAAFIAAARTDLPRALAAVQVADVLAEAADKAESLASDYHNRRNGVELVDVLQARMYVIEVALAAYRLARSGGTP